MLAGLRKELAVTIACAAPLCSVAPSDADAHAPQAPSSLAALTVPMGRLGREAVHQLAVGETIPPHALYPARPASPSFPHQRIPSLEPSTRPAAGAEGDHGPAALGLAALGSAALIALSFARALRAGARADEERDQNSNESQGGARR